MSNYPEGLPSYALCQMEGCIGKGYCSRCGETNYALMGYYGAIARWAKAWDVSKDEAERIIREHEIARFRAV